MRHGEAGAFAANAGARLTDCLMACAGTCGPDSLKLVVSLRLSAFAGFPAGIQ
jgi:thiamine pyrophosphate-dependent acetolactate synthase large subunit-like protein